jgi:hypothetical protein
MRRNASLRGSGTVVVPKSEQINRVSSCQRFAVANYKLFDTLRARDHASQEAQISRILAVAVQSSRLDFAFHAPGGAVSHAIEFTGTADDAAL